MDDIGAALLGLLAMPGINTIGIVDEGPEHLPGAHGDRVCKGRYHVVAGAMTDEEHNAAGSGVELLDALKETVTNVTYTELVNRFRRTIEASNEL